MWQQDHGRTLAVDLRVLNQGSCNTSLNNEKVIDLGPFFCDMRFNTQVRIPRAGANWLSGSKHLEEVMTYAKYSWSGWFALVRCVIEERIKRLREMGMLGLTCYEGPGDIFRRIISLRGSRGPTHRSPRPSEMSSDRAINITKKFSDGILYI